PFATQPKTLSDPAQREQRRSEYTDGGIAWQQADQHCRAAHQREGIDERGLAAEAIARMAKQHCPEWSGKECQYEDRQGLQRRRAGIPWWKEYLGKHDYRRRCKRIEIKIFDGGSHQTCEQYPAVCSRRGYCRLHEVLFPDRAHIIC